MNTEEKVTYIRGKVNQIKNKLDLPLSTSLDDVVEAINGSGEKDGIYLVNSIEEMNELTSMEDGDCCIIKPLPSIPAQINRAYIQRCIEFSNSMYEDKYGSDYKDVNNLILYDANTGKYYATFENDISVPNSFKTIPWRIKYYQDNFVIVSPDWYYFRIYEYDTVNDTFISLSGSDWGYNSAGGVAVGCYIATNTTTTINYDWYIIYADKDVIYTEANEDLTYHNKTYTENDVFFSNNNMMADYNIDYYELYQYVNNNINNAWYSKTNSILTTQNIIPDVTNQIINAPIGYMGFSQVNVLAISSREDMLSQTDVVLTDIIHNPDFNLGVYRVNTINDRDALQGVLNDDICVVYRNNIQPINETVEFSICTFPNTVNIVNAFSGQSEITLVPTNNTIENFSSWGYITNTTFELELSFDQNISNMESITYTSSDGIVYNISNINGSHFNNNVLTIPFDVKYYNGSNSLDTVFENFMITGEQVYTGTYLYDGINWLDLNALNNI